MQSLIEKGFAINMETSSLHNMARTQQLEKSRQQIITLDNGQITSTFPPKTPDSPNNPQDIMPREPPVLDLSAEEREKEKEKQQQGSTLGIKLPPLGKSPSAELTSGSK